MVQREDQDQNMNEGWQCIRVTASYHAALLITAGADHCATLAEFLAPMVMAWGLQGPAGEEGDDKQVLQRAWGLNSAEGRAFILLGCQRC